MKEEKIIEDATNVYRTNNFIVMQNIGIQYNNEENNVLYSHDTYYRRTRARDKHYENIFKNRKNINGKRIPTTMHARIFIY